MKKILFWTFIVLISLVLFVWWNWCVDVPLKISPETSLITEPLTPDGKRVDYLAWVRGLYPKDFCSERNAGWRILKEIDPRNLTDRDEKNFLFNEDLWKNLCTSMKLDPNSPRLACTNPDVSAIEKYVATEKPSDENFLTEILHDWNADDFEWHNFFTKYGDFMRYWVEKNAPALDRLEEIALDPKAEYLLPPLLEIFPDQTIDYLGVQAFSAILFMTHSLHVYGDWNLFQGDTEKALRCVEATNRLGILMQKENLGFVPQGMRIYMQNMGRELLFTEAKIPLTAEQWKRLRDLPFYEYSPEEYLHIMKKFKFQYFMSHIQFSEERKCEEVQGTSRFESMRSFLLFTLGYDWNQIAREFIQCQKEVEKNFLEEPYYRTLALNTGLKDWPSSKKDTLRRLRSINRKTRSHALAQIFLFQYSDGIRNLEIYYRTQTTQTHLFRLFCALQLYRLDHDGQLPPAFTTDAEGKPLHSWTVQLLPYLGKETEELYAKIRLDEPWDSEWNKQFHNQMPGVFTSSNELGSHENTSFCWVTETTQEKCCVLCRNIEAKNWMAPTANLTEKEVEELRKEWILMVLRNDGLIGE